LLSVLRRHRGSTLSPYTTLFRSRRAAEQLHVAQPGLSQQIKALERELDVKLMDRGPWGVRLTGPGELLLRDARRILEDVEAAIRSEEHTSELQSRENLVCRLLLE